MRWAHRLLDLARLREPRPEADLGDGRAAVEGDYFAKRHVGNTADGVEPSRSSLIHYCGPDIPARPALSSQRPSQSSTH